MYTAVPREGMGHTGGWAYAPVASGDIPRGTPMRGQGVHVLKDIPGVYTTVPKEYVAAQSKLIPYEIPLWAGYS